MSALLLGHAFKAKMGTQSRKLVLLKLVDACEDDGTSIYPSLEKVSLAAECSVRQVQRVLAEFWKAGLIEKVKEGGKGPGSTVEWSLSVDALIDLQKKGWDAFELERNPEAAAAREAAEKVDTVATFENPAETVSSTTLETNKVDSRSPQTPPYPSEDSLSRETIFEKLWGEWPTGARGSRSKAVDRWQALDLATAQAAYLFAGAYRQALRDEGRTFTPSVDTYLRDEPWHGQQLPDESSARRLPAFGAPWWWKWHSDPASAEARKHAGLALSYSIGWLADASTWLMAHDQAKRLVKVPVDGPLAQLLRSHYAAKGITLPLPDKAEWIYAPADLLDRLEQKQPETESA